MHIRATYTRPHVAMHGGEGSSDAPPWELHAKEQQGCTLQAQGNHHSVTLWGQSCMQCNGQQYRDQRTCMFNKIGFAVTQTAQLPHNILGYRQLQLMEGRGQRLSSHLLLYCSQNVYVHSAMCGITRVVKRKVTLIASFSM